MSSRAFLLGKRVFSGSSLSSAQLSLCAQLLGARFLHVCAPKATVAWTRFHLILHPISQDLLSGRRRVKLREEGAELRRGEVEILVEGVSIEACRHWDVQRAAVAHLLPAQWRRLWREAAL